MKILLTFIFLIIFYEHSDATLYLKWEHVVEEKKPVSHFNIYRRDMGDPNISFDKIATVPGDIRLAEDTTAVPGKSYCYRIAAANDMGESYAAGEVCHLNPGVAIHTQNLNQIVAISRRKGNIGVISLLVNDGQKITMNSHEHPEGITLNHRVDKKPAISAPTGRNSSVVAILIDEDEVIMVNDELIPKQ